MQQNVPTNLREKYAKLVEYLRELSSVAVGFSGGVDSTLLLRVAHDVLGEKVVAVTAESRLYPRRETDEAAEFCRREGIRQIIYNFDETKIEGFEENPVNRCYICKRALFTEICRMAKEEGMAHVVEGSNMDDNADYRPGHRAVAELGIKSPLRFAGLWKKEIRELSESLGLPTFAKPSFACLASRIPYGERITPEKLAMADKAEELLREKGFGQMRVRVHGQTARIEILPEQFPLIMRDDVRGEIVAKFKEYGFLYVSLDMEGYRTGSMNEALSNRQPSFADAKFGEYSVDNVLGGGFARN